MAFKLSISIDDIDVDTVELTRQLIPTLHLHQGLGQNAAKEYGTFLIQECKKDLSAILPFTETEAGFIDLLLEKGEIHASLLTADSSLQQGIQSHPLLKGTGSGPP